MKLSIYAKKHGISYRTAWNHFKAGQIPGAKKLASGTIVVLEPGEAVASEGKTAVYARVSSSESRANLQSQSRRVQEFCAVKGWQVGVVVEECASGLNDSRPKLMRLLADKTVTRIVVEHKDRLTRFGFNYLESLWEGEIVVINAVAEDERDLMQDFVSLVTSFTARLYGKRRSRRNIERLIESLKSDAESL